MIVNLKGIDSFTGDAVSASVGGRNIYLDDPNFKIGQDRVSQ